MTSAAPRYRPTVTTTQLQGAGSFTKLPKATSTTRCSSAATPKTYAAVQMAARSHLNEGGSHQRPRGVSWRARSAPERRSTKDQRWLDSVMWRKFIAAYVHAGCVVASSAMRAHWARVWTGAPPSRKDDGTGGRKSAAAAIEITRE